MGVPGEKPLRLLVVLPSWVGDAVMATPALRALRSALPGWFIGGLMRPGMDELLDGTGLLDESHAERAGGMMGHKHAAARLRVRRYDAALLLTNSFSTALVARLAGIPRRVGYRRDGRGLLLTGGLSPARRRDTPPFDRSRTDPDAWAPVAACVYYHRLAAHFLSTVGAAAPGMGPMELRVTESDRARAGPLLSRIASCVRARGGGGCVVMLNPGGNNPAKRWPAERFAEVAEALIDRRGAVVVVSGSAGERELTGRIAGMVRDSCRDAVIDLPALAGEGGLSLGALKAVVGSCRLMVTNDTGPRHIAAALGVPVVSLFGPTDHRWTVIPFEREAVITADPTLPEEEVANDHPARCRIDRIETASVIEAAEWLLGEG